MARKRSELLSQMQMPKRKDEDELLDLDSMPEDMEEDMEMEEEASEDELPMPEDEMIALLEKRGYEVRKKEEEEEEEEMPEEEEMA